MASTHAGASAVTAPGEDVPPPPDPNDPPPSHRALATQNLAVAVKAAREGHPAAPVAAAIAQAEALLAVDDTLQRLGKVLSALAAKR